eukprot:m.187234 g.187234  ORF g.187234 m.187234 type:complete len:234 (+) comp18501_c0_seq7:733-1434(+)
MWTMSFATYDNSSQCDTNMYLIEPTKSTSSFAFYTYWPSFAAGNTIYMMYDALSGERLWERTSDVISYFHYSEDADMLIELNMPDLLQARNWRDWDAAPVWKAPKFDVAYQQVSFAGDLMFLSGGGNTVAALDVHTGKQKWATHTAASAAKHVEIVAGTSFWYHAYSETDDDSTYLSVTVEKRHLHDGSLEWTHANIASVQYGWFSTSLSANGDLLYIWPTTQGGWVAALSTK